MALFHIDAYLFSGSELADTQDFRVEAHNADEAERKASDALRFVNPQNWAHYQVGIYPLPRSQSWRVTFADGDSDGDEEIAFSVLAYDVDDAITLAQKEAKEQPYLNVSTFLDARRVRGGRRPGAGRPPEDKPKKTVVKRIPVELADKIGQIDSLLQLIEDWKERASTAPETSPRWDRARELLSEISEVLGE